MKHFRMKNLLCVSLAALTVTAAGTATAGAAVADYSLTGSGESATPDSPSMPVDISLPESYSSLDLGYVTPVKSQIYNSCWAFASMATLESALLRGGFYTENMSTTHLNLWATTHADGTGWLRSVTDDGYPCIPLGYVTSWQGGVFESEVSDLSLFGDLTSDDIPVDFAHYGVTAVRYLQKDNPDEIKRSIMDDGGVYASFSQTSACMSADGTSYYMPPDYSGSYTGHSIEVVGWDDNYPKEKFKTSPENNGAWLIKNSWGNNNILGGYFWLSYEDKNVFTPKYTPSYSFSGIEQIDGTKKLIQNEVYGATYEFDYTEGSQQTYLNRFEFDEDFNVIDKIVFETTAAGASYTLYFVPDGEDDLPDADKTKWTKLYEGTAGYSGYICADIEDFAYPGTTGSIAVSMDTVSIGTGCRIGVGEWLTSSLDMVFKNSSRRGESFILQDGGFQDLLDWYRINNDDDIGGTFVIKAVTAQYYPVTLLGDANCDGYVDIRDVTCIQRHLAEHEALTKTAASNADYNRDGKITIDDCTKIQRYLAEFED